MNVHPFPYDWPGDAPPDPDWPHRADWPAIVAFPRSGTNWIRYCVEYFSSRRTSGRILLVDKGPPVVGRTHDARGRMCADGRWDRGRRPIVMDGEWLAPRLLLVVRDPVAGFVTDAGQRHDRFNAYIENIRTFDTFPDGKLFVHYEDLITGFETMSSVLTFIGVPHTFPLDAELQRRESALRYHLLRGAHTLAAPRDFQFHRRSLSVQDIDALLAWCARHLGPDLTTRYLARYMNGGDART